MADHGRSPVSLEADGRRIVFRGLLGSEDLTALKWFMKSNMEELSRHSSVVFDFGRCEGLEAAPGAVIYSAAARLRDTGTEVEWLDPPEGAQNLFESFRVPLVRPDYAPSWSGKRIVEDIGESGREILKIVFGLWSFSIRTTSALFSGLAKPASVRWKLVLYYMEQSGAKAVPIIAVLCWLLGTVLGYMAGYQLKSFAAEAFMPDMVALSMVWEIAPLLAAVLVAGRSGSAFAAELGTMQVRQEVDALEVMGFNTLGFMVTPKMLALMCIMPFLTLLADVAGILGGMIVGELYLDMPVDIFIDRVEYVLLPIDIWWGLLKSIVYAVIVANVGCFMGMRVKGGAAEVGRATTSAVVTGIFLVIVADALIAIAYMHIRPPVAV